MAVCSQCCGCQTLWSVFVDSSWVADSRGRRWSTRQRHPWAGSAVDPGSPPSVLDDLRPVRFVDNVGGAALNVMALVLVAWVVASVVAFLPRTDVTRQVNESLVLTTTDRMLPEAALSAFDGLRDIVGETAGTESFCGVGSCSRTGRRRAGRRAGPEGGGGYPRLLGALDRQRECVRNDRPPVLDSRSSRI